MNVGDIVRVVKCDVCPKVVGKTGSVVEVADGGVRVRFGKGRPQLGRPDVFSVENLEVVNDD